MRRASSAPRTVAIMVSVAFSVRDERTPAELLRLSVAYGEPVELDGDSSWLDFSFSPISRLYGRAVTWEEDCEEWTRALAEAYATTPVQVTVLHDSAPYATAIPAAASAVSPADATPMLALPPAPADPSPTADQTSIAAAASAITDQAQSQPNADSQGDGTMLQTPHAPKQKAGRRPKTERTPKPAKMKRAREPKASKVAAVREPKPPKVKTPKTSKVKTAKEPKASKLKTPKPVKATNGSRLKVGRSPRAETHHDGPKIIPQSDLGIKILLAILSAIAVIWAFVNVTGTF